MVSQDRITTRYESLIYIESGFLSINVLSGLNTSIPILVLFLETTL
nr:MAG TPA: hypothetical protein [Bacteriophage sp.]